LGEVTIGRFVALRFKNLTLHHWPLPGNLNGNFGLGARIRWMEKLPFGAISD